MVIFGLALPNFIDPEWQAATLVDVQGQGSKLVSDMGLVSLRNVKAGNMNLHIGCSYLISPRGKPLQIDSGQWSIGQKPDIQNDAVASGLTETTGYTTTECRAHGHVHIFVSATAKKRRIACNLPLGQFLLKERSFPDAVVTCGQSRFEVHRSVLAQNSVFKRGLGGTMVEA